MVANATAASLLKSFDASVLNDRQWQAPQPTKREESLRVPQYPIPSKKGQVSTMKVSFAYCLLIASFVCGGAVSAEPDDRRLSRPASTLHMARRSQSGLVLLAREDVAQDIELVADQEQAVRVLVAGLPDRLRSLVGGLRDLSDEQRRERVEAFGVEMQQDIQKTLLPHQAVRLAQIAFQLRINAHNIVDAFTTDEIVRELDMSDSQIAEVKALRTKLNKIYKDGLSRAREQVTTEILAVLSLEQREKWNMLVGPPFIEDPGFDISDTESLFSTSRSGRGN